MRGERYSFLGVSVDDVTMDEAVVEALALAKGDAPGYVLFLNTDVLVKADGNEMLRSSIEGSRLSLMDGKPPLMLARWMGVPLREKVSGSDFVPKLCAAAADLGLSLFILGGSNRAAEAAAINVSSMYPGIGAVRWFSPPIGFEKNVDELVEAVMRVREYQPDVLIVCLGCPKQETIVAGLLEEFGVSCVVCAGATVDFLAGTVKRAPGWISAIGIEWLYRFSREPKRLFRRYFIESWRIVRMAWRSSSKGCSAMGLRTYALKAKNGYYWWMDKLAKQRYIREYPKYLRQLGVRISERPGDCWISPTVFLDSSGYEMIEIGDNCTISFDAVILIHDYSINNAFKAIGEPAVEKHRVIKRPVKIGSNCFIGARAIIMPGAVIGDNCIVGSGAVVRGNVPAGSIVSGNPATVIAGIEEFAHRHMKLGDWEFDER